MVCVCIPMGYFFPDPFSNWSLLLSLPTSNLDQYCAFKHRFKDLKEYFLD